MSESFKKYLLSVNLDPDELCIYWSDRIEEHIKDLYLRAKGKSLCPIGFEMRPLTFNEIKDSLSLYSVFTVMLGKRVHCDYMEHSGILIGIYTDELDYYYAIEVDGKTEYHSCVGKIKFLNHE